MDTRGIAVREATGERWVEGVNEHETVSDRKHRDIRVALRLARARDIVRLIIDGWSPQIRRNFPGAAKQNRMLDSICSQMLGDNPLCIVYRNGSYSISHHHRETVRKLLKEAEATYGTA